MSWRRVTKTGVAALLLLLSFFTDRVYADYVRYGPQPTDDDFYYFGDEEHPKDEPYGITLIIDEASISHTAIIGEVRIDPGLIEERNVRYFCVLANGRCVDYFEPTWDYRHNMWQRVYAGHRFAFESWNTGTAIRLQIVAVANDLYEPHPMDPDVASQYVVAWSNVAGPYTLKSLPVIDYEAVSLLQQILNRLNNMQNAITSRLDQINQSIRQIYEVSPQTQAKFDAALANLQAKLPTEQIKQQANQMRNIVDESANRINNTPQKIKFGEIEWLGVITTPALDLSEFEEQLKLLRDIVRITIWCEFFYFVILVLRPRLTV